MAKEYAIPVVLAKRRGIRFADAGKWDIALPYEGCTSRRKGTPALQMDPMDEILKDADVIDHSLSDPTKEVKPHEQARYAKLCGELGFADV